MTAFAPAAPLAYRTERIEPFHVMELTKEASRLEAAGRSIIHMSIGEPDFTAPPIVLDALERAARGGHTQYTSALGTRALREAIARDYGHRYGLDLSPSRVIVTAGASGALMLAFAALINPGEQVLMPDPTYPCNRHFVSAFDGEARLIPCGPGKRYQLDADDIAQHWTDRTRGVLVASPSNPTGTRIAEANLRGLVGAVRERRGFVIADEIYLGLSYDEPARSALTLGDDIIVCNSFSKYFSMTGWRLGWLVVPEAWAAVFEKLSQNLYICASSLAQHAALACFTPEAMQVFEQRRDAFRQRRDMIVPALESLGLQIPVRPDGAFYVYADCSRFSQDSDRFAWDVLHEAGVALVPGKDFGMNAPERHVRLSYATSMERLEEAVRRLRAYLG